MTMDRGYQPEPEDLNERLSPHERELLQRELQDGYGNVPIKYDDAGETQLPRPDDDYEER